MWVYKLHNMYLPSCQLDESQNLRRRLTSLWMCLQHLCCSDTVSFTGENLSMPQTKLYINNWRTASFVCRIKICSSLLYLCGKMGFCSQGICLRNIYTSWNEIYMPNDSIVKNVCPIKQRVKNRGKLVAWDSPLDHPHCVYYN